MLSSDPLDFYWLVILRDSVHLVPDYPGLPSQSDYATWNYRFSKSPLLLAVNVLNHYYKCYFYRRQRLSAQNRERRSTGVRRNLLFWLKLKCDVMFWEIDVKCCYVKFCNFSVKGQKSGPEAVHHGNTRTGEKTAVQCKLHNCRKSVAMFPFALSSFCFHTYRVPKKLAFVAAGTCPFFIPTKNNNFLRHPVRKLMSKWRGQKGFYNYR